MWRVLFEIPGYSIRLHSFSMMMIFACFSAYHLTVWGAKRQRIDPESVFGLAIWLMGGGFIGARALFVARHPETIRHASDLFRVWQGGMVFYGCILGGLTGTLIYWARHPFPFRRMADAVAPALMLGLGLGRIGCFLNGCCFGAASHLPWAVTFPEGSPAWAQQVGLGMIPASATHSLALHPVQLYEAIETLLLLAVLIAYSSHRRREGRVMALLMLTYPPVRFVNELLRSDEGPVLAGLTISQLISVIVFSCGAILWISLRSRPATQLADAAIERDPMSRRRIDARHLEMATSRVGGAKRNPPMEPEPMGRARRNPST